MLALFAAAALALGNHPDSNSSSRVVVAGTSATLELRCQSLSLIECLPLDRDGDRRVSAAELEQGQAAIAGYLNERYVLEPAGPRAPWVFELDSGGALEEQRVQGRTSFALPEGAQGFSVRCTLFQEQNPLHRDTATVLWNAEEPAFFVFGDGVELWHFESADLRRPSVLASYLRLGFEHILTGYDHIAFLLALLVAAARLRSLVGVVTAFTAAHSVTLACAALGAVSVPGRLVELAIALSIAYVGAENLLSPKPCARWLEAFGFGLVHGLGFAGFLADSLVFEPLKVSALVGFNLGVELGQLGIVFALAAPLRWLPGERAFGDQPRAWFAPRWLRLGASVAVTVFGLYWFAERAGWLAWAA